MAEHDRTWDAAFAAQQHRLAIDARHRADAMRPAPAPLSHTREPVQPGSERTGHGNDCAKKGSTPINEDGR
jgi:hypothetical protein